MTMATRNVFTGMWRTIMLRGLASLVFGLLAFFYPGVTLAIVVTIFGIYALIDGLLGLWGAFSGGESRSMGSLVTSLAGIAAGLFCLIWRDQAAVYVVLLIGLWYVAAGLLQLIGSLVLRNDIDNAGMLALGGAVGAALGLLIMFYPKDATTAILWIIAATAVVVGLILLYFGWKLRGVGKRLSGA
jgi:uncharacterized membrane protein HdeD (DUF308 family)